MCSSNGIKISTFLKKKLGDEAEVSSVQLVNLSKVNVHNVDICDPAQANEADVVH